MIEIASSIVCPIRCLVALSLAALTCSKSSWSIYQAKRSESSQKLTTRTIQTVCRCTIKRKFVIVLTQTHWFSCSRLISLLFANRFPLSIEKTEMEMRKKKEEKEMEIENDKTGGRHPSKCPFFLPSSRTKSGHFCYIRRASQWANTDSYEPVEWNSLESVFDSGRRVVLVNSWFANKHSKLKWNKRDAHN